MNILIKNMLDCLIGAITYWSVGWALAYGPGGNGFAGGSQFFAAFMDASSYPSWFFQVPQFCKRENSKILAGFLTLSLVVSRNLVYHVLLY